MAAGRIALDSETAARWASEGDGAVVARQLGKVCLVGCSELAIDMAARRCRIGTRTLAEGDWLCLDGNGGRVLAGRPEFVTCRPTEWLQRVEGWKGRRGDSIPATAGEFAQGVSGLARRGPLPAGAPTVPVSGRSSRGYRHHPS
jgi:hypothetical protein